MGTFGDWGEIIPDKEWRVYQKGIDSLRRQNVGFLLGGAFGLAAYTGRWRNTKDIDLFLMPSQRELAIDALREAGFTDYYATAAYDRSWIFRATRGGLIVDLIWALPNRRTQVDPVWFRRAGRVELKGEALSVIPAEELLWIKLYVMQRDRCDWPDIMNLLYVRAEALDWVHLLGRLEADTPLLSAALELFIWLCPERSRVIPSTVRKRLRLRMQPERAGRSVQRRRIDLLDTRPWFAALQPTDQPMTV